MSILHAAIFRPRLAGQCLPALFLALLLATPALAEPRVRSAGDIASLLAERRVWTDEMQTLRAREQSRIRELQARLPGSEGSDRHAEIQMEIEVVKHQSRLRYLEALEARAERAGNTALAAHVRTRIEMLRPLMVHASAPVGTVAR